MILYFALNQIDFLKLHVQNRMQFRLQFHLLNLQFQLFMVVSFVS